MKLRVAERAQQQASRMEAWWVEHRPSAPELFTIELEETFRAICSVANAGIRWPTLRHPAMRRILMRGTNNHVYFEIDRATSTVNVHAVWGAPKRRGPKL